MKKIEDYIHLYIGQKACDTFNDCGVEITHANIIAYGSDIDQVKPILRPLSDMTDKEFRISGIFDKEMESMGFGSFEEQFKMFIRESRAKEDRCWYPEMYVFFLRNGFDIHGLIDAGLAITKTPAAI